MNSKGRPMNKKLLKLLYRSFDENLKPKEQKKLAAALVESLDLQKEKEDIIAQRRTLSENAAPSFQPFFAERVMAHLASAGKKENGLTVWYNAFKIVFLRFAAAGLVIMLILVTYNLSIDDSLSSEEVFFTSDATYEELQHLPLF